MELMQRRRAGQDSALAARTVLFSALTVDLV